jgi:hypothetical protein
MANTALHNVIQRLPGRHRSNVIDPQVFGPKLGLIRSLMGCHHQNLSRPFGNTNAAYRSCLDCGARKQFNTETLETSKRFYSPPVITQPIKKCTNSEIELV